MEKTTLHDIRGNGSVEMLLELLSDSSEKPGWLATERCDSQKGGQFLPLQLLSVQVFSPLLGKAWTLHYSLGPWERLRLGQGVTLELREMNQPSVSPI